jgi:glycosyltransferase involved in cell wall biosynthesis
VRAASRHVPSISAFFPAYNDGGTIASMAVVADHVLRELTDDYEIVVINDCSSDYTGEVLQDIATKFQHVRIISHDKNRGYGGALRSGFAAATKDLIFYTDGDAQYDPHELAALLEALSDEVHVVNGFKIERNDPMHRKLLGRIYHTVVRAMFNLHLRDVDCDFRLLRRSVFDKVHLESNSGVICVELIKKLEMHGFRIAEVPVHHYNRTYGKSQFFRIGRLARVALGLARLWVKLVALPAMTQQKQAREGVARPLVITHGQVDCSGRAGASPNTER